MNARRAQRPAPGRSGAALADRWKGALMDTYGTPPLALVRGRGVTVEDADGRTYLDFIGGIAVNALGHGHPAVVEAVGRQLALLGHVSNLYVAEPPVRLAERLLELAGREGRVFFSNSGAEAVETAFKIARRTGRTHMVSAVGGFHGRTMGALALTGQPAKQEPFLPLPGEVSHVPYGDVAALRAAVSERTAAVVLEPVQGENGVVPAPPGYLRAAREITEAAGALLVLDEIQTGMGRTGHWFAHRAAEAEPDGEPSVEPDVEPDIVTLAKGLGGGLPIGATLAFGRAADLLTPGQHGSTFGGNPVTCAAALAVIATIEADGLLDRVRRTGERLRAGIEATGHPLLREVRGAGLLLGVVLAEPVAAHAQLAAQEAGFLVNAPTPDVLRLAPPLILTEEQADAFADALPGILGA
ncbi:acetylornithine transaminase [Streptomyces hiroshimensis]|uniref:Acetylornithine aminotransferase n=1 Tax=Streptomyces hiroshimensis TaxID=66424 RepID=A0ABQ2YMY8_9ACTN|nr:acetylornithine transaminase [Streptomyces hiroshimensis]GGX88731.1 acetylornithine aminotransferase [Streptomyces hiroshimensis]